GAMNNEEPYRDQAERLKRRIEKINAKVEDKDDLPPRELIHRQKKKKTKWKLKYPVIRLLVLFFILLPIIIFSVISYRDGAKKINGVEKTSEDNVGYETINLEKSTDEDENNPEKSVESSETITENSSDSETEETSDETIDQVVQPETKENTSVLTPNTNQNSPDTEVSNTNNEEKEAETSTFVSHTVQPDENLYKLAMKYYNSPKGMDIIIKANNLKSDQVSAGQVLKIPMNN
ncbi:MAG: LysM peptidoglycan-binding domain-containing protein, partial [Bacillus sp. (in: firmicutes)]